MLARTSVTEEGLFRVMDQVAFSARPDSIKHWLSRVIGRKKIRVFAGYSGWIAGQLEAEIQQGAWNVLPASDESVFDTESSDLWRVLTALIPGHDEV